jgi:hypothetical protein
MQGSGCQEAVNKLLAIVDGNEEIRIEVRAGVGFALRLDFPVRGRSVRKDCGWLICGQLEVYGNIAAGKAGELVAG